MKRSFVTLAFGMLFITLYQMSENFEQELDEHWKENGETDSDWEDEESEEYWNDKEDEHLLRKLSLLLPFISTLLP
ncbi:MAG: hypothetical protein ACJATI_003043 [Halioglobus sp.]|jgi:TATA-binding protein-associated factor Taf7